MEQFDLLELLHVDTKEDVYTFCLQAFLEGSIDCRRKSAKYWGFSDDDDYNVVRCAIESPTASRKVIIPDLMLFNNKHVAVIESKMYSSEGYKQTIDYDQAKEDILGKIETKATDISFFYFTLAGIPAENKEFKIVSWSEYYADVLEDIRFDNEDDKGLKVLAAAIFERAKEYQTFSSDIKKQQYSDLINNKNSWIRPYSLFTNGLIDKEWNKSTKLYRIYNGVVHGQGHATYRTDIWKCDELSENGINYCIKGEDAHPDDNIFIFTRIEWSESSVQVILNLEYWRVNNGVWEDYIPNKKLGDNKEQSKNNREKCWAYIESLNTGMRIPSKKENALHMVIKDIDIENKNVGQIIEEIKVAMGKLEEIEDYLVKHIQKSNSGYLTLID
ncbi:MAG: hypothetical protein IJJ59_05715 [Pseudobutyrivibrio sp.]|uniref:hypothetical protein n=1 Tax=Pseudobutyrivibrio sp. TaxID=2014367 RepID=UPI0025DE8697|nr:hypothetical protein [Pseudobutyrivibrio sp.]MBQ6462799.1 hypothetical protein [Pseudobutyrivibrio sp.]